MSDVVVVGNVGSVPELRFTRDGKPILGFSLAEGHRGKVDGEWADTGTTWRRVTVWGRDAEALAEVLGKGDRVLVAGSEELKEFEGKNGPGKSLELTAKHVGIVPKGKPAASGWAKPEPKAAQGWGDGADDQVPF